MVLVPTRGNPVWRKVRWSAPSDQVAVPSVRRSGWRCAVAGYVELTGYAR